VNRVSYLYRPLPLLAAALVACGGSGEEEDTSDPALLTAAGDLPFVYPPALYAARIEGDVGLRLFVDSLGLVVPESTSVAEPSTHAEFDSAAVAGAPYLEFQPAKSGGSRVGKTVVLPVKFRVPPDSQRRDTLPGKR
jgi:TonB family protein